MSYAVWLIIFRNAEPDVCRHCLGPSRKSLNLKFNSKVLISCCDSGVIEEWWSIRKDRTESQEIGRLIGEDPGGVGIYWSSDELVHRGRYSMDGRVLRVASVKVN